MSGRRWWFGRCGTRRNYPLSVDSYPGELTTLTISLPETALQSCSPCARSHSDLSSGGNVEQADRKILARTEQDIGGTLARYFRIDESSESWWTRRPSGGPPAEFLTR